MTRVVIVEKAVDAIGAKALDEIESDKNIELTDPVTLKYNHKRKKWVVKK